MKIRKILAPIDFSDVSAEALAAATDLARQLGAKMVVLHAVEPVYFAGSMFGPEINVPQLVEEQRRAAESAIQDMVERLKKKQISAIGMVETGVPHDVVLRVAEAKKCDLIVVGTHGRSGVSHLLLGSVAEKLVRSAQCPVLTLRGKAAKGKSASRSATKKK